MPPGPRLIVGNLDCEVELAHSTHVAVPRLPEAVSHMISAAAAACLPALGRPGDRVWTPRRVEAARTPERAGVELVSGDLGEAARDCSAILPWCETPSVAELRAGLAAPGDGAGWLGVLWRIACDPAAVARCNDKRFAHELAVASGVALPGARIVESVDELEAHLHRGGASHGHEQGWVIKAPYSASGRSRLRQRGKVLETPARVRAERLLGQGALVFEPWVRRLADFGTAGVIDGGRATLFAPHRLEADAQGVFRGVTIADHLVSSWLERREREELAATARAVGDILIKQGYAGAFTVDSFVYLDGHGRRRINPLCEINARLGFGLVARAHAEMRNLELLRLRLAIDQAREGTGVDLLLPGAGDTATAWLETTAQPS